MRAGRQPVIFAAFSPLAVCLAAAFVARQAAGAEDEAGAPAGRTTERRGPAPAGRTAKESGPAPAGRTTEGRGPAPAGGERPRVYLIPIDDGPSSVQGMVDRWQSMFVSRQLDAAKETGVDLILFRITTNGGRADSAIEITNSIAGARPTRTVAFVVDRAISAGALIALACDEIYMEPGSIMGDIQAVAYGPEGPIPLGEKVNSVMRARLRSEAERRAARAKYPESVLALAEAMTDPDVVVHRVKVDGEEAFVRDSMLAEFYRERDEEGSTVEQLEIVVREGKLLTMTAREAFERYHFIEGVVKDREALFEKLGMPTAEIIRPRSDWSQPVARYVSGPFISGLLLTVAMLGLMMELYAPGKGVGGLVFLFGMGLFFWSHFVAGEAGALEIVLFFLGVALLAVEVFLIPGFGVAGVSGLVLIVASLVMSFIPKELSAPDVPSLPLDWSRVQIALLTVLSSFGASIVGLIVLARFIPRAPFFRHLVLSGATASGTAELGADAQTEGAQVAGLAALAGKGGIAATDLRPAGKVEVEGELVDAVTESEFIEKGRPVRVLEVSGFRVVVQPATSEGGSDRGGEA